MASTPSEQPRIVILGAGPAGLFTAHYLRERGYNNVLVLEKLGRVGGLCKTMTYAGRSFDLGANYVTPAYTEVRKAAKRLGLTLYTERPMIAMSVPEDPSQKVSFKSIFEAMRVDADTGKKIPLLKFTWANLRYVWLRWKLRNAIDRPTFAGLEHRDDLCVPFGQWLRDNRIGCLKTVFQLPVNLMGYGTVETTAAAYPLKFMTLKTFIPMVLKEMPFIGKFTGWPKRFTYGYQRFLERLSWDLDVRLNIRVTDIERSDGKAYLTFQKPDQILNEIRWEEDHIEADHLILACPLPSGHLRGFMKLNDGEERLFDKIETLSYCMTTHHVEGLDLTSDSSPLAACFPVPPIGTPWGVAKQWADSDFTQFYTRVDPKEPHDSVQKEVEEGIRVLVSQMGGRILADNHEWHTYNRWPYFQHVSPEVFAEGWYSQLEALQGNEGTYYAGGATNFELVEPIAEYAKNLVETHFPAR